MTKIGCTIAAAGLFMFSQTANATVWNIDEVLNGGGGFGASLFHSASTSSAMSGTVLATILSGVGIFGTYNDVSGAFNATFSLGAPPAGYLGPPSVTISNSSGPLVFGGGGGFGELTNQSTLDATFSGGTLAGLITTTLGFNPGFVCCGNNGDDPNSFHSDGAGGGILTLWGANGFDGSGGYPNATLGMDLRIHLTAVPVPMSLPLFGTGLAALGLMGWRRKRRHTAELAQV